ncbi:MAG: hypothetical protein RCG15_02900 [Candidatus Rickettsia vulgarisii]
MTGNVNYIAGGTVNADGGIIGNVDFKNNTGTLSVGNNQTITGTVNSTTGVRGTLNFAGGGGWYSDWCNRRY